MNIQNEVAKIHNQFGRTEMANYKIEKLFEQLLSNKTSQMQQKIDKLNFDLEYITGVNNDLLSEEKWQNIDEQLPTIKKHGEKVLIHRKVNPSQASLATSIHDTDKVKYCEPGTLWRVLPKPI
jgi:hypothetical protein